MQHSTRKPTLYEQERMDAMMALGCVACAVLGIPNLNDLECHHIVEGNKRLGHWWTIPLCVQHHQGQKWNKLRVISVDKRVSISSGSKAFARIYGTQRDLWERVQNKLGLTCVWPESKILRRRSLTWAD